MSYKKAEIIELKKLKKDGSIDHKILKLVVSALEKGHFVVLPVDCIYGIVAPFTPHAGIEIRKLSGHDDHEIERLVSSFKMLDMVADIGKLEFDFLHRIWPGEIVVRLRQQGHTNRTVPVRMPRTLFMQELIAGMDSPLFFTPACGQGGGHVYKKSDIISRFKTKSDYIVLVGEFCKEHNEPSVVDISSGTLSIVNEGRISAEEIKSLYFLGKDDINP